MTIEYKCDSCGKNKPTRIHEGVAQLPRAWMVIVLRFPTVTDHEDAYALCDECSGLPMRFGNITKEREAISEDG